MQTMSHLQALHAALQRRRTNPLPCQLEPAPDPLPCQLGPAPERPRARRGKLGGFKKSLNTTGLYLLRRVADGRMQATDAQDTCAHIVNDYGVCGDVVAAIAASGTYGAHPQNCYRDIMRFVHQIGDTLDPVDVEITLRNPDGLGNITRMHPVLYPHDVLSNMHNRLSQTQFATLIGADGISTFWDRHKNSPWVQNHPGFPRSVQTDIAVPIYIHADAGQHTNLDKILVISWGSSVTSASTLLGLFLFTVLPCALMIAGTTDEQLYQVLVWCLWVLLRGEHPATNHTNTPWPHGTTRWAMRGMRLAGRYCALFSEYRGDWEWQIATFRWRGYRHNFICHRCWASKVLPSLLFTDWAATALWQTTSLSHEGYMESTTAVERTVLCTAPGWRLERTLSDKMHCINLGLLLHLIANVLWFLTWSRAYLCLDPVDAGLPADASWDQVLHELEVRFHRWGKAHNVRCQVPRFTLNAINRDSQTTFPHYKCKASKSDKSSLGLPMSHVSMQRDALPEQGPKHCELLHARGVWQRFSTLCAARADTMHGQKPTSCFTPVPHSSSSTRTWHASQRRSRMAIDRTAGMSSRSFINFMSCCSMFAGGMLPMRIRDFTIALGPRIWSDV